MTTTIEKNSAEEIRITLNEFQGKQLVSVRTYWRKSEDEIIPTKKGVSLPVDKLDELIDGLEVLRQ